MPKRMTEHELEMWAADLLMEAHAIAPCPTTAICVCDTAITLWTTLSLAVHRTFSSKNKKERIAAVESVLDGLSDECPAC